MSSDPTKADPKLPHAFLERANVPYNAPRPSTDGVTAMDTPVRRLGAPPECALCGRDRSHPIHEAAEEAADAEEGSWPL